MSNYKLKIKIIATGGSIAGLSCSSIDSSYKSAIIDIDELVKSVPNINKIADISTKQLVKIPSQDMNNDVWLKLSLYIEKLLKNNKYDGIIITHGTDTMEETAYFLNLTVHSDKPIILVGAMKPYNALNSDGPKNIYNALLVVLDSKSKCKGVLVVMNDLILGARDVSKLHTTSLESFQAVNFGPLGFISGGKVFYSREPMGLHTFKSEFNIFNLKFLPKVGIVYSYVNAYSFSINFLIKNKFTGIVCAGVGNGNIYKDLFNSLILAQKSGIQVVRSSRIINGFTTSNSEINDDKYHFIASKSLSPQKARILLMLSLTKTKYWKDIKKIFNKY